MAGPCCTLRRTFREARRVTIITPEIEAGAGGLADYTLRLLEHWPFDTNLQILTRRVPENKVAGPHAIRLLPSGEEEIFRALCAATGPVLIQYSAFGYDPAGNPEELINAVTRWKSSGNSSRLVVMFHEIWMFVPFWNRRFVSQKKHRRLIGRLALAADVVVTSTASQAAHLREVSGRSDVSVLPVGSNITPHPISTSARDGTAAVIFGLAHSRLRALGSLRAALRELARANTLTRITTIGHGDNSGEATLLEDLKLSAGHQQLGACSEAAVSREFQQAAFAISDQDPLSYSKSGTLMAYAEHGLNIISPFATATSREPFSFFFSPAELQSGVSLEQREERARLLKSWQARTASWPSIADFFLAALRPPESPLSATPRETD